MHESDIRVSWVGWIAFLGYFALCGILWVGT
jgi:hypothetical protein